MKHTANSLDRYWAGGFLFNPKDNSVLLHLRDNNTKINPNMWAFFGGLSEGNDKSFIECFVRELHEEIGLLASEEQVIHLCEYTNAGLETYRIVFYVESEITIDKLNLGEGASFKWIPLEDIEDYQLTEKTKNDLAYFKKSTSLELV